MLDNPKQVASLMQKMKAHLPIPVKGTAALVRQLNDSG
jgi:hypothetical protein